MNMRTTTITLSLYVAALCACGGAEPASELVQDLPADGISPASHELLAEISVGQFNVAFFETRDEDGNSRQIMREVGPADLAASPMQPVLERGLTALEAFLALAPEDESIPEELLAAHSAQAQSLGRADVDSVLELAFEPPAVTDKSAPACDAYVLHTSNGRYTIANSVRRWVSGNVIAAAYTPWTQRNVALGICNDSATTSLGARPYFVYQPTNPADVAAIDQFGIGTLDWSFLPSVVLTPRSSARWYDWSRHPPETCDGFNCTMAPTKYAIAGYPQGSDIRYHLRSAELLLNVR